MLAVSSKPRRREAALLIAPFGNIELLHSEASCRSCGPWPVRVLLNTVNNSLEKSWQSANNVATKFP